MQDCHSKTGGLTVCSINLSAHMDGGRAAPVTAAVAGFTARQAAAAALSPRNCSWALQPVLALGRMIQPAAFLS